MQTPIRAMTVLLICPSCVGCNSDDEKGTSSTSFPSTEQSIDRAQAIAFVGLPTTHGSDIKAGIAADG